MTWSNKAADIQEKYIFEASWPGEDYNHELWTYQDISDDFEDFEDPEFLSLVFTMKVDESLYEEESNLLLRRVPASYSLGKGVVVEEDTYEEV